MATSNEKLCDACDPLAATRLTDLIVEPDLCTCCNKAYAQGGRSICNACAQRDGVATSSILNLDRLPPPPFVGIAYNDGDDVDEDADPNEDLLFSVLNESRVNAEAYSTSLDEEIEHAQDAILYLFNRLPECGVECLRAGKHTESCQRGIVLDIMSGDRNAKGARI